MRAFNNNRRSGPLPTSTSSTRSSYFASPSALRIAFMCLLFLAAATTIALYSSYAAQNAAGNAPPATPVDATSVVTAAAAGASSKEEELPDTSSSVSRGGGGGGGQGKKGKGGKRKTTVHPEAEGDAADAAVVAAPPPPPPPSPLISAADVAAAIAAERAQHAETIQGLEEALADCKEEIEDTQEELAALQRKHNALVATRKVWGEENTGSTGSGGVVETQKNQNAVPLPPSPPSPPIQEQEKQPPALPPPPPVSPVVVAEAPPPPPPPAARPHLPPLLVIGIPTIRREGDPNYLERTVDFIMEQTRVGTVDGSEAQAISSSAEHPPPHTGDVDSEHPIRLRVLVLSNTRLEGTGGVRNAPHVAFETLVQRLCDGPAAPGGPSYSCSSMQVGMHTVYSRAGSPLILARNGRPIPFDGNDEGNPNVPGYRVRQQTRDVADLLGLAHDLFGHEGRGDGTGITSSSSSSSSSSSGGGGGTTGNVAIDKATLEGVDGQLFLIANAQQQIKQKNPALPPLPDPSLIYPRMAAYMFMEDDFRLCTKAAAALGYMMNRATAELGEWNAIRTSYGLNGAVIRGHDVPKLQSYYLSHIARRPPDHLLVEWFAGERPESAGVKRNRPHVAFRYNILEHFGFASSLRASTSPVYAYCYDEMNDAVVFEVEAYKSLECGHDDIWPCWKRGDIRYQVESSSRMEEYGGVRGSMTESGINFQQLAVDARGSSVQNWR